MGLKAKFRLTVAVAAAGFLTLSSLWLYHERSALLEQKEDQARNLVAVPLGILEQQYRLERSGKLTRPEAQAQALQMISLFRYDKDNYFWVNDMQPVMLMHPMHTELNGKDLSDYRDPLGKAVFLEMIHVVRTNGAGFVKYQWTRPRQETMKPVPKLSFVAEFKPWGWVIGTGVYLDDVDAAWQASARVAAGVALVCLGIIFIAATRISARIFPRLEKIVERMNVITEAKADFFCLAPIEERRKGELFDDEIQSVVSGFNEMLLQIKSRDEQLRQHEEILERLVDARTAELKIVNSELAQAHTEIETFLEAIPSLLIGLDGNGLITRWNLVATQTLGIDELSAKGRTLDQCGIKWLNPQMDTHIAEWLRADKTIRCEDLPFEKDKMVRFLGCAVRPVFSKSGAKVGYVLTGADVTERKCLEEQLRQAQKLEAIGQLAAGIAHEINTPTQFVGDNTRFLKDSWKPVLQLLDLCRKMQSEASERGSISMHLLAEFDRVSEECDISYLVDEIPRAIDQSLDGLQRVAKIVRAMQEFSHRGSDEKGPVDINRAILSTITVARSEWKHVAEIVTDLCPENPVVIGRAGELKQVILNLIVNASHAIADVVGDGEKAKGMITIRTRAENGCTDVSITDTGTGIPAAIQSRVFEPFFTSKPVGKGTGQGLALAHSIIVKGHQGELWFETVEGKGTTFYVRLRHSAMAKGAN